MAYDASRGPDPKRWILTAEDVRLEQVLAYHKRKRIRLPNAHLHALMHVVVESQLAERYEPAVQALDRLTSEGLDRHEAVHAIASVVIQGVHDVMQYGRTDFDREACATALRALSAESWRKIVG